MDTNNIQLTDGLIFLRPPKIDDIPAVVEAVRESLAELHPWMDWATDSYDEDSAKRWLEFVQLYWEHSTGFQFAILDAASGQYLGNCGADGINEKYRFCNLVTARRGRSPSFSAMKPGSSPGSSLRPSTRLTPARCPRCTVTLDPGIR